MRRALLDTQHEPVARHFLSILTVLAAGSPGGHGSAASAPLRLDAKVEPERVTLGQPFDLDLVVTHVKAQRYELTPPGDLGDFELVGQRRSRVDAADRSTTTVRVTLVAFKLGRLTTPRLSLDVTEDGRTHVVAAPVTEITVLSSLPDDAAARGAALHDVRPPEAVLVPSYRLLWAVGGAAVAAGLGYAAWQTLRRRRARPPPLAPPVPLEARTLQALEALKAEDLPGQRRFKEFYFRLSELLRAYLGERFAFEALECTTPELLSALRARRTAGLDLDAVAAFAEQSDFARYAKAEPSIEACAADLELASRIVRETTQMLPSSGPPDEESPRGAA